MIAVYAKKIGMSHVFNERGGVIPVTVLEVPKNFLVSKKKRSKYGYDAVVLSSFVAKEKHVTKPLRHRFPKNIAPQKKMFEVRGFLERKIGEEIGVEVFEDISFVDVSALSKGKGFQGVMKRHGASGGPAKHGSKFHRSPGSVGNSATPSKLRKGVKMPGHMGGEKCTVQNLKVVRVDIELGMLVVCGAVPGANGGHVLVREAIKKRISSTDKKD